MKDIQAQLKIRPFTPIEDELIFTAMASGHDSFGPSPGGSGGLSTHKPIGFTYYADDDGSWLIGAGGDDTFIGGAGSDFLFGKGGNDAMLGNGGNDALYGDAGNDALYGGAGNDTLEGGNGNDHLVGGWEDDWMAGGAGADRFSFQMLEESGKAGYIDDFTTGQDTLSIRYGHTPVIGTATNYMEVQVADSMSEGTMLALADIYLDNANINYVFMTNGSNGYLFASTTDQVDIWIKLGHLDSKADFDWSDIVL